MVRLKDIAAKAGVSIMTVSKVLHDAADISAGTKTRIRLLAQQMGYVPDTMAQSLRTKTTKLLGLIIPAMTNPTFARVALAIEEKAHDLGYDLVLAHSLNDTAREETIIRRLISRRVDGIFLAPVYRMAPSAAIYQELEKHRVPTILLGHPAPFCQQFVSVETDDFGASYALTKYLLGLGHRRIAYLAGPPATPSAAERREGYKKAMREGHIQADDDLVFNAGNTIPDGERAALQMINEGCDATAIQAHNDLVAIGALALFSAQGIKIPEQISVGGFGNILISEYCSVPLTTVRQPKYRLGVAAMEVMQKLLHHEPATPRRLPAELVLRASTAPPQQLSRV